MGTRGAFGFRLKGVDKIVYNHSDSYPSGLGQDIVQFLNDNATDSVDIVELKHKVSLLEAIDPDSKPDPISMEVCKKNGTINLNVGNEHPSGSPSWYQLLRGTQGNMDMMLRVGRYQDYSSFLLDSLMCEWAYIVNLDDSVLEVYEGFKEEPHTLGRYSALKTKDTAGERYYPVALVGVFRLDNLPKNLEEALDKTPVEELSETHDT